MTDAATALRDRLTRRRLVAALPPGRPRVRSFTSSWWDGASHVPCLVARVGNRRVRAVETHGGVLLLPASTGRARRALHAWRCTPLGPPLAPALASPGPRQDLPPAVGPVERPSVRLAWQPVIVPPPRRAPELLHIDQDVDVQVCAVARCGGLRVVPPPGQSAAAASCPCCGVAA